jgi:hypothetical protein
MRVEEFVQLLRSRADDYDRQARASLTQEQRDILQRTANTFRRLADQTDAGPPRWLEP